MIKKRIAVVGLCALIISSQLIGCSVRNEQSNLNLTDAESVEADNSKSGDTDIVNSTKSDEDLINSFITEDIDKLLSLYYKELDGAFAEGYASSLLRLFKKTDLETFIEKTSGFEKEKTVGILSLLVGEFSLEDDEAGLEAFETKLEEMRLDPDLTAQERYVVYEALAQVKYMESRR